MRVRQLGLPAPPSQTTVPNRRASMNGRLLLLAAGVASFVIVLTVTLRRDDPAPGLSIRTWVTLGLAGALLILLGTVYSRQSPIAMVGELAKLIAAAALAGLLIVPAAHSHAKPATKPATPKQAQTLDLAAGCPAISEQPIAWARCAWKAAGKTVEQHSPIPPTTTRRRT
jgi:hypothetical protein